MDNEKTRCGTCRHWRPVRRRDSQDMGACKAPLPESIVDDETATMHKNDGETCQVWVPA